MPKSERDGLNCRKSCKSDSHKLMAPKPGDMARDDRRAFVLGVLEDSGVAIKSIDVFRNCKLRGAMFEHRTTKTYLADLIESGDVLKVDSQALGDGRLVEIDTSERGHFIAASVAADFEK